MNAESIISFLPVTLVLISIVIIFFFLSSGDKRKNTREPIALAGLVFFFLSLLLCIVELFTLFYYNQPVLFIQDHDAAIGSTFFTLLFVEIMAFTTIFIILRNWSGAKSTRQAAFEELNKSYRVSNMFTDAAFYLRVLQKKEIIELYQAPAEQAMEVFLPYEVDTRPWYQQVATLLPLVDQQYIIAPQDWYGEYHCYISKYGQDGKRLAILCLEQEPKAHELVNFLSFTDSIDGPFHKLVVAQRGEGEKENRWHGEDLLEWRYESELLDALLSPATLASYERYLDDFFHQNNLENSELTLDQMYVPLRGQMKTIEKEKLVDDFPIESVEEYILDWVAGKRQNAQEHLSILGDYGQGKTVLTHKLTLEILQNRERYQRIPILIELRGSSPRNEDEFGIFSHWAKRFKAPAEALWELHRAGKTLVILDGFDEMDLVGDTEILFNHFQQLWSLARTPQAQIIIAGRPNLFADDVNRRRALGIQLPRLDQPYTRAIYLAKLTPLQINQVLREVEEQTQIEIKKRLTLSSEESSFVELITRPSTLYQLSTVWDQELASYKDRLNSATVIRSFLQKSYQRQERKKATVLTSSERDYFNLGIAVGMMLNNGYTNKLTGKELRVLVKRLWDNYPAQLPPYEDAMQGNQNKPLPQRLKENEQAFETVLKDVRVGSILVQDLSGSDVFKFSHKSYLEYLVSAFYASLILEGKYSHSHQIKVNTVQKVFGFSLTQLKSSTDVEQFTVELISSAVEVEDQKSGEVLPIEGNEAAYSELLYQKLVVGPFPLQGRFFPRWMAWMGFHPHLWLFFSIGLLSMICMLGCALSNNTFVVSSLILTSINTILCIILAGVLIKYHFHLKRLSGFLPTSLLINTKLYLQSCRQLRILSRQNHSETFHILLFAKEKNKQQRNIVELLLDSTIAFAFAIPFSFAFVVAIHFASESQDAISFFNQKQKIDIEDLELEAILGILGLIGLAVLSISGHFKDENLDPGTSVGVKTGLFSLFGAVTAITVGAETNIILFATLLFLILLQLYFQSKNYQEFQALIQKLKEEQEA